VGGEGRKRRETIIAETGIYHDTMGCLNKPLYCRQHKNQEYWTGLLNPACLLFVINIKVHLSKV